MTTKSMFRSKASFFKSLAVLAMSSKTIAAFITILSFSAGILVTAMAVYVFHEYFNLCHCINVPILTSSSHGHRTERQFGLPEGISQSPESQTLSKTLSVDQDGTTRGP